MRPSTTTRGCLTSTAFSMRVFSVGSSPTSGSLPPGPGYWTSEQELAKIVSRINKRATVFTEVASIPASAVAVGTETFAATHPVPFKFNWAGALRELRSVFGSVELQHRSIEWR